VASLQELTGREQEKTRIKEKIIQEREKRGYPP
jgi:hypothetical protein